MIPKTMYVALAASVFTLPAMAVDFKKVSEKVTDTAGYVAKSTFTGWSGDVAFLASFASGNTEKEEMKGEIELNKEAPTKEWGHTVKASAETSKEDGTQTEEEYRVSGQSRFNLSEKDFAFGELEYENDRFGGYQYRMSEGVGYGYRFYNNETFSLTGEVSGGARQEKDTEDQTKNTAFGKLAAKAKWQINEQLALHEDASISFADGTTTRSETSLRNNMSENLYLKVSYTYEHNSEVPEDTEETDTVLSVGVGYRF